VHPRSILCENNHFVPHRNYSALHYEARSVIAAYGNNVCPLYHMENINKPLQNNSEISDKPGGMKS
jgi:hypothetical protein